jgi:hypothetical protein
VGVYPAHGQGDEFREGLALGPGFFQESLAAEVRIFGDLRLLSCAFFQNQQRVSKIFLEILRCLFDLFQNSSTNDPHFSGNLRVGSVRSGLCCGDIVGAVAPTPPRARSAAAPDGAPPRREGIVICLRIWKFHGVFRDLCKVMAYQKEPD